MGFVDAHGAEPDTSCTAYFDLVRAGNAEHPDPCVPNIV